MVVSMRTDARPDSCGRVAVVGAGPKAVAALVELERLLAGESWSTGGDRGPVLGHDNQVTVSVWDPAEAGPGAVWDPATPVPLIMNVSASIVDLSCPSFPLSYVQWAQSHERADARDQFPPRARMGEYLRAVWGALSASPWLSVHHIAQRVVSVEPDAQGTWTVVDESGARSGGWGSVLLATGHRAPVGRGVYEQVRDTVGMSGAPGEGDWGEDDCGEVVIRGAALTGIDMVLLVTEGRGGQWVTRGHEGSSEWEYVSSGREPRVVTLLSRSGIPLSPKPQHTPGHWGEVVRSVTCQLVDVPPTEVLTQRWWDILLDAAHSLAHHVAPAVLSRQQLWDVLTQPDHITPSGAVPAFDPVSADALARMTTHLRMNHGDQPPDAQWVWGRVWNLGYRDIIGSLDRGPRPRAGWELFRHVAVNAERWAYGPPEKTVRKLIALTQRGLLRWAVTPPVAVGEEHIVPAVTQPAGVLTHPRPWEGDTPTPTDAPDPLWRSLLTNGDVTVRPGERGILTDHTTTCINANGTPTHGLHALGRPTEDPIIGHDTLNHTLHGDCAAWAATIHTRLHTAATTPPRTHTPTHTR